MRKSSLLLFISCLMALVLLPGSATAQGFDDLPGLEQGVVRAWLAPETAEADPSTPVAGPSLAATPAPVLDPVTMSGTIFLSIGVFDFDSDESATNGFESLAAFVAQVSDSDPQFAGGSRTDLGIGDQSLAATSNTVKDDIPFSFLVAAVRQGDMVYLLQGTLLRLDAPTETTRLATALIAGAPGDGDVTYDAAGGSTGGLWDVFAYVEPALVPGTEVMDGTIKEP